MSELEARETLFLLHSTVYTRVLGYVPFPCVKTQKRSYQFLSSCDHHGYWS
jgi:hypothetical protein